MNLDAYLHQLAGAGMRTKRIWQTEWIEGRFRLNAFQVIDNASGEFVTTIIIQELRDGPHDDGLLTYRMLDGNTVAEDAAQIRGEK